MSHHESSWVILWPLNRVSSFGRSLRGNKLSCKRSLISSCICLQISRSSGPSRAMKIAPPTEQNSNSIELLESYGHLRTADFNRPLEFVRWSQVQWISKIWASADPPVHTALISKIRMWKMCPTRFTLVGTPPEERPYNSHRMCLAWSFLTVWLIRFMAMTSQTEIDGLWRHITRLGRLMQVHLHERTSHSYD